MRTLFAKLLRLAAGIALAVPTLGCTPARLLNAIVTEDGYRIEKNLAYGEQPRQTLDIYVPDGAGPATDVVVFFYGGRWEYGSKEDYLFVGQALASKGVIAVLADYRLYPDVRFPGFVKDGAKAVGWVRRHIAERGGDSDRIFLMGHSAGAHIAAMLALNPEFLAAENLMPQDLAGVIGLAGPYDFLPIKDPVIKKIFARDDMTATQPITFASADAPPMLLLTGDRDRTVLPRNSERLARSVNKRGGEATVQSYQRLGHVGLILALASPFRWLAPTLKDVIDFIDRPRQTGRRAA